MNDNQQPTGRDPVDDVVKTAGCVDEESSTDYFADTNWPVPVFVMGIGRFRVWFPLMTESILARISVPQARNFARTETDRRASGQFEAF